MSRRSAIAAWLVVLVYAVARLWRLTDACLWFDEIFSMHAAEHDWAALIPFVAKDLIHPPLFYILLKLWIAAGGESVLWLRLFPVVLSVLALVPLWRLCGELKLRASTRVVAIGFLAVNGALIKYAQEVRMYSLLLFLALMSVWLFSRFYFRGKSFWALVAVNILLVYSHYFGWFVIVSEAALIVAAQRIKLLQALLMWTVVAAAFVPWVFAVLRFAEAGSSVDQNIGWMRRPGMRSVFDLGLDLVDPFYFQQSSIEKSADFVIAVPMLLILAAALIVHLGTRRESDSSGRLVFLSVFVIVPLVLVFVLSWVLPVSIWGARHLIIVFAPALLLASASLTGLRPALLGRMLTACATLLAGAAFVLAAFSPPRQQIWCAWEGLANEWAAAPRNGTERAALYVFEDLVAYHYWFATRRVLDGRIILVKDVEGIPTDPAYFLPRGFSGIQSAVTAEVSGDEIWISFRGPSISQPAASADPHQYLFGVPVMTFQNLGYSVADVRTRVMGPQTAYLVMMRKAPQAKPLK